MANFGDDKEKSAAQNDTPTGTTFVNYVQSMFDPTLTWKDIEWLKRYSMQ